MSEKQENEKIATLEQRITKIEADLKKAQDERGYRKMIHKNSTYSHIIWRVRRELNPRPSD